MDPVTDMDIDESNIIESSGTLTQMKFFTIEPDFQVQGPSGEAFINLLNYAKTKDIQSIIDNIIKDDNYSDIINRKWKGQRIVDFAWDNNYYDLVLVLLLGNSDFPLNFQFEDNPSDKFKSKIMDFAKWMEEFHRVIKDKDFEDVKNCFMKINNKVKEIFDRLAVFYQYLTYSESFKLKYYLNTSSKSAALTAIENKKFDVYINLKSEYFCLKEEEKVSETSEEFSDYLGCAHINYLLSKTKIFKSDPSFHEIISKYYNSLDKIEKVSPILKYLKHCNHIEIHVDLYNKLTKKMDPKCLNNYGHTYIYSGKIYVALGRESKLALGTLSHEFSHLAMFDFFRNKSKPYRKQDTLKAQTFKHLTSETQNKLEFVNTKTRKEREMKNIIGVGFKYPNKEHEAELIVRIVEILAVYKDEGRHWIKANFSNLYSFFDEVLSEIKNETHNLNLKNPSKNLKLINRCVGLTYNGEIQLVSGNISENLRNFLTSSENCFYIKTDADKCQLQCNIIYAYLKRILPKTSPDEYFFFTFHDCSKLLEDLVVEISAASVSLITLVYTEIKIPKPRLREMLKKFLSALDSSTKKIIFIVIDQNSGDFEEALNSAIFRSNDSRHKASKHFRQCRVNYVNDLKCENFKLTMCEQDLCNMQFTFTDFDPQTQNHLLQNKNIILQGNIISLGEIFKISDVSKLTRNSLKFFQDLDPGVIKKLLTKKDVVVGENYQDFDDSVYMSRRFNKVEIAKTIEVNKTFTDKLTYKKKDFEDLCSQYPKENIHWLEKGKNTKSFTWIKTKGSVSALLEYKVPEQSTSKFHEETTFIKLQNHLKVIIISDLAGMGKSTVLSQLVSLLWKEGVCKWIFKINLNDYTTILKKALDEKISTQDLVYSLLNLYESFDKNLFDCKQIKTAVMLDGFDEISPDYKHIVVTVIKYLENKVSSIWVTTRLNMKSYLEGEFQVIAFTFKPLSKNEQVELINKIWKRKLKKGNCIDIDNEESLKKLKKCCMDFIKKISRSTSFESDGKFLSIPLHVDMISKIFYENKLDFAANPKSVEDFIECLNKTKLNEKLDVLDLYKNFLKIVVKNYLEGKLARDASKPGENFERKSNNIILNCKIIAVQNIVDDPKDLELFEINKLKLEEFKQKVIKGKMNIGVVYCSGKEPELHFIHRNYAEYLASEFIADELIKSSSDWDKICCIFSCIDKLLPKVSQMFFENLLKNFKKSEKLSELLSQKSLLNFSAERGFLNIILTILDSKSENLIENCETKETILHCAAKFGKLNVVNHFLSDNSFKLLNKKLKNPSKNFKLTLSSFINIKDESNHTALYYAFEKKNFEIGYKLLIKGAGYEFLNVNNENASVFLKYIFKNYEYIGGEGNEVMGILEKLVKKFPEFCSEIAKELSADKLNRLLCSFLNYGHIQVFKDIFNSIDSKIRGKIITSDFGDQSILIVASKSLYLNDNKRLEVLKFIFEHVFKLNKTVPVNDKFLETIVQFGHFKTFLHLMSQRKKSLPSDLLTIAFQNSHFIIAWYLLLNENCSVPDVDGNSALHLAVKSNSCLKLMKFVIEFQKEINLKNSDYQTPLNVALSNKEDCHLLSYLIDEGANHDFPFDRPYTCSKDSDFKLLNSLMDCGAQVRNNEIFLNEKKYFKIHIEFHDSNNLFSAIKNKNLECCKFSIFRGDSVNLSDSKGKTPLHWACVVGTLEIVQLLLQHGAMFDVKDSNNCTPCDELNKPYCFLSDNDKANIAKLLTSSKDLFYSKCFAFEDHKDILHYILNARNSEKNSCLHTAIDRKDVDTLKTILHWNEVFLRKKRKWCLLRNKNFKIFRNYQPLSIDAVNSYGNSPLHNAAKVDNRCLILKLLNDGVIFNEKNDKGKCPKDEIRNKKVKNLLAVTEKCFSEIEIDFEAIENRKIIYECFNSRNHLGESLLHVAIKNENSKLFALLLEVDEGKNINLNTQTLNGCTPLHLAVEKNELVMVKKLLQRGAFYNVLNKKNKTPLELAKTLPDCLIHYILDFVNKLFSTMLSDQPENILDIFKTNEDKSILPVIINSFDRKSNCLLHYAAKFSCGVHFLLENGAMYNAENNCSLTPMNLSSSLNIQQSLNLIDEVFNNIELYNEVESKIGFKILNNVRNKTGETLLHIAVKRNNRNLIVKLLKSGSDVNAEDIYGKKAHDSARRYIAKNLEWFIKLQDSVRTNNINEAKQAWTAIKIFFKVPSQRCKIEVSHKSSSLRNPSSQSKSKKRPPTEDQGKSRKKTRMTNLQGFQFKESHLFQLKDMGLSMDESKKALYNTQNQEIDEALKWIVKHFNDKDFDQPLDLSKHETDDTDVAEALEAIVMMGFSDKQARWALSNRENNLEKAVDLILGHMETNIGSNPWNFSKLKTKNN